MTRHMFCNNCGNILTLKNAGEKTFGLCSCGFAKEITENTAFGSKLIKEKEVGEIIPKQDSKKIADGFPHVCKKCGHEGAEVYDIGAPYSDESNIILYECNKCKFVEREAYGTGNN